MSQRKKAFTLIELLVVIAIIALLLSILMPSLQLVKSKARMLICMSNVRQVTMACVTYATDYDGFYPSNPVSGAGASPNYFNGAYLVSVYPDSPGNNFALDIEPYLQTLEVFKDPSIPHAESVSNWNMDSEVVWPWWYLGGGFSTLYGLEVDNKRWSSKAGTPLFSDHCINGGGAYGEIRTNHVVRDKRSSFPDSFFTHLSYGYSYHCWNVPYAGDDELEYVIRLNTGFNDGSTRPVFPEDMVKIGDWFPNGTGIKSP